jgi:nicotinate-nucleotide adenylyltransferase
MPGKHVPISFGSTKVKPPLTQPGQRIGIMGGSFNPPHDGHGLISRTALRRLGLDQLWWVVTPGNPLKVNNGLPPASERMELCRRLAGGDSRMRITAFEEDLRTPYTAATVAFLTRRYPGVQFFWIMGADNLASFHRWQLWRDIAMRVPIAVVDRPGWHLKALASPAAQWMRRSFVPEIHAAALGRKRRKPAWTFLTGPLSKSSSTDIRNARPREEAGSEEAEEVIEAAVPRLRVAACR